MPQRLAYNIWTIGCQMNEADARRLSDELDLVGFAPSDSVDQADLVVLYSCVVRQAAENKVHGQLLRLLTYEEPESYPEDSWMTKALTLRDQWESRLLRTAPWSPLW